MLDALFKKHLQLRVSLAEKLLAKHGFDTLVINAGAPIVYYADDADMPFRSTPHFAHWCPAAGPHHLLIFQAGQKPQLNYFYPNDFWYEHFELKKDFWTENFKIEVFHELPKQHDSLKNLKNVCFIGPEIAGMPEHFTKNPDKMLNPMNWDRSYKSDYEIHCLKEATKTGAKAHKVALDLFKKGASEKEIYYGFVEACDCTANDLAYTPIIGLNEKAAILHYHNLRDNKNADVMLIDAGAKYLQYGCDITRTYLLNPKKSAATELFSRLLDATETLQLALCDAAKVGMKFAEFHSLSEIKVAQALIDHGILKDVTADAAVEKGLARTFYPHGVGHMLGIQTHDVGGKQADADDSVQPQKSANRYLRSLRTIDAGQVFTVEPGIYFIPLLLDPRRKENDKNIDWKKVDMLMPLGGIRIEDNILITKTGHENLTRQYL